MNIAVYALTLFLTANRPEIHTPTEGSSVGAEGDPTCAADQPCPYVHAAGSVPEDRAGIFAVMPHNRRPSVWVQEFIPGGGGGKVSATVNLGHGKVGAKEWFSIFLLSCERDHGLEAKQTSFDVIDRVCERSEPVNVYRER